VSRLVETQIYRVHNVLECRYSLSIHLSNSTAERAAAILSDSSWNRNLLIRIDWQTNCNIVQFEFLCVCLCQSLVNSRWCHFNSANCFNFLYRIQNIKHKTNSNETNNIKLTLH